MNLWKRIKNIWKLSEIVPTEESLIVQGLVNQFNNRFSKKASIIDISDPLADIRI